MSIYQAVIAFRPLQYPPCFKSWIIANRCHVESTPGCRRRLCKSWSLPLGRSCQGSEKPGCSTYCSCHRRWGKGELSFCCVLRVSVSKTVLAKWGHTSASITYEFGVRQFWRSCVYDQRCSQVIGLSSAYQLALRGVHVTVLEERQDTGQARSSLIRQSYKTVQSYTVLNLKWKWNKRYI